MSRPLILGSILSGVCVALAVISMLWTPFDHTALDIPGKLQPPGGVHVLGTDHLGRDMLSMIMVGTRTSIAVALLALAIGVGLGVPLEGGVDVTQVEQRHGQ